MIALERTTAILTTFNQTLGAEFLAEEIAIDTTSLWSAATVNQRLKRDPCDEPDTCLGTTESIYALESVTPAVQVRPGARRSG